MAQPWPPLGSGSALARSIPALSRTPMNRFRCSLAPFSIGSNVPGPQPLGAGSGRGEWDRPHPPGRTRDERPPSLSGALHRPLSHLCWVGGGMRHDSGGLEPRLLPGGGSGSDSRAAGGPQLCALPPDPILRLEGPGCPPPSHRHPQQRQAGPSAKDHEADPGIWGVDRLQSSPPCSTSNASAPPRTPSPRRRRSRLTSVPLWCTANTSR